MKIDTCLTPQTTISFLCTSLFKNLYTYPFLGLIPRSRMVGCYGRYTCNILINGNSSFVNWKFREWIIDLDIKSKIIILIQGKKRLMLWFFLVGNGFLYRNTKHATWKFKIYELVKMKSLTSLKATSKKT